jgi:fibronectin type 3 domain-containing protein
MPNARLIDKSTVVQARRRDTIRVQQEREEARKLLREARTTNQVIELTLEPEERESTLKLRYRQVAKEEGLTVRFQTAQQRTRTNKKDVETVEAEILLVVVSEVAPASSRKGKGRA